MSDYVEVIATVTDKWGNVERVPAGTQPAWAWEVDKCAAWRKMMRGVLLQDRTAEPNPRGWRVEFEAVAL